MLIQRGGKMKEKFIIKLETNEYYIGSFDVYIEESTNLLSKNSCITLEEATEEIKKNANDNSCCYS